MNRGNGDDAKSRRQKAEAEALALLTSVNSRGKLAPLPAGTIVQGKYKVERFLRASEPRNRNLYVVTWNNQANGLHCWECGYEGNALSDEQCAECHSSLSGRQFLLSERWYMDFKPFYDVAELGLNHQGLARVYDVFEQSQRLFTLTEYREGQFLSEVSSPFSPEQLLAVGQRAAETLHYLHINGVRISSLGKDQIMLQGDQALIHDPDIVGASGIEIPPDQRAEDLKRLGRLLREYAPSAIGSLRVLSEEAMDGELSDAQAFANHWVGLITTFGITSPLAASGGMSDVGMFRTLNEDSWGWEQVSPDVQIFVVADGMGGHDSGEIASEMAVRTILSGVRGRMGERTDFDDDALENLLDEAFQEANNTIKGFSEKRRSDMGTTMVSAMIYKGQTAFVANVGDSRAYLIREGELTQISQDHSLVANLVAMGKITKAAARNHPHSNILVRTVGKERDVEIDIFRQDVQTGDRLLLCSDGLWGEVDEDELLALVTANSDPRAACLELVRSANNHGGHDNVTVLVVEV